MIKFSTMPLGAPSTIIDKILNDNKCNCVDSPNKIVIEGLELETLKCVIKEYIRMCHKENNVDRFAHELKEAFNAEFPINYESTQPFFTLDNVHMIVDMVAAQSKNSDAD